MSDYQPEYIVTCAEGRPPEVSVFDELADAIRAAEEKASGMPGKRFVVSQALYDAEAGPVEVRRIGGGEDNTVTLTLNYWGREKGGMNHIFSEVWDGPKLKIWKGHILKVSPVIYGSEASVTMTKTAADYWGLS